MPCLEQSQGAGAAQSTGGEVSAVPFPGSSPLPELWSPTRAGTSLHAGLSGRAREKGQGWRRWRRINHGWSCQGSGSFPRAQQRAPALPVSCMAGEDTAFLGGDGKVRGVWGTAPSARRFTMVRVKPQPPCQGVAEWVPSRDGCSMWGSVSREGRTGAEGREGEGISAPAVARTDPEGSSHSVI